MKKNFLIFLIIILGLLLLGGAVYWSRKGKTTTQKKGTTIQEKISGKKNLFQKNIDVCEAIPSKEISRLLGKPISRTKKGSSNYNPLPSCFYYLEGERTVYIELDANQDINVQTKGYKALGWKTEKDSQIPMDNFVVYNNEGKLYLIFLLPNSKSYVTVNPWSSGLSEQEIMNFTAKFADYLKENFSF